MIPQEYLTLPRPPLSTGVSDIHKLGLSGEKIAPVPLSLQHTTKLTFTEPSITGWERKAGGQAAKQVNKLYR